ncbi:unnamed protein product [Closterium sp. NIES-65]|nr:unnamed protein product [Closterium sp. NIES-65]
MEVPPSVEITDGQRLETEQLQDESSMDGVQQTGEQQIGEQQTGKQQSGEQQIGEERIEEQQMVDQQLGEQQTGEPQTGEQEMWGIRDGGRVLVSGTTTAPVRRSTRITRGVPPVELSTKARGVNPKPSRRATAFVCDRSPTAVSFRAEIAAAFVWQQQHCRQPGGDKQAAGGRTAKISDEDLLRLQRLAELQAGVVRVVGACCGRDSSGVALVGTARKDPWSTPWQGSAADQCSQRRHDEQVSGILGNCVYGGVWGSACFLVESAQAADRTAAFEAPQMAAGRAASFEAPQKVEGEDLLRLQRLAELQVELVLVVGGYSGRESKGCSGRESRGLQGLLGRPLGLWRCLVLPAMAGQTSEWLFGTVCAWECVKNACMRWEEEQRVPLVAAGRMAPWTWRCLVLSVTAERATLLSFPPTNRRRVEVTDVLVEREFELALEVISFLHQPAVQINVSVAASLAEKHQHRVLFEGLMDQIKCMLHARCRPLTWTSVAASLAEKQQHRVLFKGLMDQIKYMLPPAGIGKQQHQVLFEKRIDRIKYMLPLADMDEVIGAAVMVYTHTAIKLSNLSLTFTRRQDMSRSVKLPKERIDRLIHMLSD